MQFPVLCIPKGIGMYYVAATESLGRCRPSLFWRAKVYDGMRIVDSAGNAFAVRKSEIVRPATKFGQAIARFFDATVQLELVVQAIEPPPMEELKAAVQAAIDDDPESFEELSGKSVQWWNDTLSRASTPREVVNAFSASTSDG